MFEVAFRRARLPQAALAALAVIVAAWPATSLLSERTWLGEAIVALGVVVVVGCLARAAKAPWSWVVVAQLLAIILTLCWTYFGSSLWWGLPTPDTVGAAQAAVNDTADVLQRYAAPAPVTPGLRTVLVASLAFIAIGVDAVAVSADGPTAAGILLAVVFLTAVSNSGTVMHPQYFLALAAVWLAMIVVRDQALLRQWPATEDDTADTVARAIGGAGPAVALGAVAAVAAVIIAALTPHAPPVFLGDGLGTGGRGTGTGSTRVNGTLDVTKNLGDRSGNPVLRYRTSASQPGPLKVQTSTQYRDGQWLPSPPSSEQSSGRSSTLLQFAGRSPQVPTSTEDFEVLENSVRAPQLALPSLSTALNMPDDVAWGQSDDHSVQVNATPRKYRASYQEILGTQLPEHGIGQKGSYGDIPELEMDDSAREAVRKASREATKDADTTLESAINIQNYLRDPTAFSYNEELAPPVRDDSGQVLDPISHFLETKQGYCVQFSSAMAMMARSEGIPARVAIGFLPGERDSMADAYVVTASDAHAWPELYIEGLGWTRFEPTPGVHAGSPPTYALAQEQATDFVPDEIAPTQAPEDEPEDTATDTETDLEETTAPTEEAAGGSHDDESGFTMPSWAPWLLLIPASGLLVLLLPLAASMRRRRVLAGAGSPEQEAEAVLTAMLMRLVDLGVPRPGRGSPREVGRHLDRHVTTTPEGRAALGRVIAAVETARYSPRDVPTDGLRADADRVVEGYAQTRSVTERARAWLWPQSLWMSQSDLISGLREDSLAAAPSRG